MTTKNVDSLIREALSRDEAELYRSLGEPSLPEMLTDLFRGRNRWLFILTAVVTAVFFFVGIYCAVRFYQAPELRDMLLWGAAFFFCMIAVVMNKTWQWMEIQRNSLTREVKRLELQITHLTSKLHVAGE